MDSLGGRVRVARERRGMTQSGLARATGLSAGAVSRIEHGERAPGSGTVSRLAAALGVDPGSLLDGHSPAVPAQAEQPTDREVLEAIQLVAQIMPSLPPGGRRRVLRVIQAALA